eukprot:gene2872-3569_t
MNVNVIRWFKDKLSVILQLINGMPIAVFYRYLWLRNKRLLFKTVAVHYLVPILIELLPWYASKRKIGNFLRSARVEITHRMSTNSTYSHSMIIKYVILTIYYAILDNINHHLIHIVAMENQLLIRRLVMEKLLYSEIGAFDFMRKKNIGPAELEAKISSSINSTISFFTYTVPDFFACMYAFVIEGSELFTKRKIIDPLIVLHPILIAIYQKVSQKLRENLVEGNELKFKDTYHSAMSKMVSNTVDGLSDIQINNLQETQLSLFDSLIEKEMSNTHSFSTLVSRIWRSIHNRSVFEFAAEVWVAHKVMLRQKIDNQEYRNMLLEINRVIRLGKKGYQSFRSFKSIYKHQKKVKKLLNIPTFIEEESHLKSVLQFNQLKISYIKYSYETNNISMIPPIPVLDLQGEMTILPGKRYALIGQNRAGKSTLNHLLCKLYCPSEGEITMNGIPYSEISRSSIRRLISYVSQRPFIFQGTIMDNIRVGNPSASEEQVLEAADAAGVFAFAEDVNLHANYDYEYLDQTNTGVNSLKSSIKSLSHGGLHNPHHHHLHHHPGSSLKSSASTGNLHSFSPRKLGPDQEELESNKLVQRVKSIINLVAMDDDGSDDEDDASQEVTPPTIVPQLIDVSNHPILNQVVEQGGKNISGGFAQSIALARIFVRTEAKIVILDEAMSQMDAFKKREIIFPKLFQFAEKNNITLIIVTHDLLSIQNAVDHIFVLDHGKLVHQGSHQQLIQENASIYLKLCGLSPTR